MTDSNENQGVLTPDQAREWLFEHGITQKEVADKLGCKSSMISDLLNGKMRGVRGKSHYAAMALRLKRPARGESPLDLIQAIRSD